MKLSSSFLLLTILALLGLAQPGSTFSALGGWARGGVAYLTQKFGGTTDNLAKAAFYHSGYDEKFQPIWVVQVDQIASSIPFSSWVTNAASIAQNIVKDSAKLLADSLAAANALQGAGKPPVTKFGIIFDYSNIEMFTLASNARLYFECVKRLSPVEKQMNYGYIVPGGEVQTRVFDMIKDVYPAVTSLPVAMFKTLEDFTKEISGKIRPDQLTAHLGGSKDHKPVKAFEGPKL